VSTFKKALLQLHIFVFLAGLTAPIGNYIQLNGLMLVLYRMGITTMAAVLLYILTKNKTKTDYRVKIRLMGVGVLIALHWVCFYSSIKLANVSIALVCFSSVGLFTVILEPLFTKTKLVLNELLIGLLSLIGILCIFQFDVHYREGIIVGLISSFLAALFTIFNKKLTNNIAPQTIQTFEMLGGFLFLAVIVILSNASQYTSFVLPSKSDWVWLIILALLCTVWANYLMLSSLKHISAFTLNVTLNLEPVYGIILAFILFKEQKYLGISFYVGISLITVSVLFQMLRVVRQQKSTNS